MVAAAGLGWGLVRLLRRAGTAYLRLAVGGGAMVGMVLLPATAATAAGAAHAPAGTATAARSPDRRSWCPCSWSR